MLSGGIFAKSLFIIKTYIDISKFDEFWGAFICFPILSKTACQKK